MNTEAILVNARKTQKWYCSTYRVGNLVVALLVDKKSVAKLIDMGLFRMDGAASPTPAAVLFALR
jgi:hypothetical protein